ncbi:uncharacterized protein LAJ45_06588 [Morchella importuna]|uniref:uncharacterized protein n=1 Tax=Morchella importuna TaxID=1174673 RepID=UPI001E8D1AE5|nr:uncharacterized protein LAJ45_06588 [Morchella importuna]KAH8149508.1 hypothetical protein LAJ45_06588 [Morchella importuna]
MQLREFKYQALKNDLQPLVGTKQAIYLRSTEPHRNELLRSINVAFGLNADRNLIWADDDLLAMDPFMPQISITNLSLSLLMIGTPLWITSYKKPL